MSESKQVIVMRKDLGMRKGKMIAQGAHASLAVILNMMTKVPRERLDGSLAVEYKLWIDNHTALYDWLEEKFTKICVSVDSEEELVDVYQRAKIAGLPTVMITDAGLTEFNNIPTKTCCSIGPDDSALIDKITGGLKLL